MTKAEIIEGMLELLNGPERWCKHLLSDGNGAYCLIGAMFMVAEGHWHWGVERNPGVRELAGILRNMAWEKGYTRYHFDLFAPIAEFNNAEETEYEDVRLFLKEALEQVQKVEEEEPFEGARRTRGSCFSSLGLRPPRMT